MPVEALGNLPTVWSRLIGRSRKLGELEALLSTHALVTLAGPAGVGKTSLAVSAARHLVERFADGAWIVDLRAVVPGDDVVSVCFNSLRLRPPATAATARDLAKALADQQRLVLIDNCEHVLDSVAVVATAIVVACPRVVASRPVGSGSTSATSGCSRFGRCRPAR